jgi:hypothetical protein
MNCLFCHKQIVQDKKYSDNRHKKRKFCSASCSAFQRHKINSLSVMTYDKCKEKFFERVLKNNNRCWKWLGSYHTKNGYGNFHFGIIKKRDFAHRVSYWIHNGVYPYGMVIKHSCDNKWCVNPEHLSMGTIAENIKEAVERGLIPYGENSSSSKLTKAQVDFIRSNNIAIAVLAAQFGVSDSTISRARNGITWKRD